MSFDKIHAPTVSVIITNYNYGRFLDDCLMSILHQTYPYIECIVFDNASTDASDSVLESIVDSKLFERDGRSLSVIRSRTNLYQTPAAAEAFRHATGNFVIFFDPDDYMLPTCVETHIRAMLSLRLPVGATCVDYFMSCDDELVTSTGSAQFSKIAASGEDTQKAFCRTVDLPKTSMGIDLDLPLSALHYLERTTSGWPWSGTGGLCFRREMIELMFRRTPNIREQLDAYLIGGINSLTGSVLIDRPLVIYRHHGQNNFADRPFISNIHFYDPKVCRETSMMAAEEIIKTYVAAADELATRLDWDGLFLEAVETVSNMWSPLQPKSKATTFMLEFLEENRTALARAFGEQSFAQWVARYKVKKYRGIRFRK